MNLALESLSVLNRTSNAEAKTSTGSIAPYKQEIRVWFLASVAFRSNVLHGVCLSISQANSEVQRAAKLLIREEPSSRRPSKG